MYATTESKNTVRPIHTFVFLFDRGKTMSSDYKTRNETDTTFSFGVRELRRARREQQLSVKDAPLKAVNENRGSDPYNTSGSFDRTKNWTRIGKR
jgi:hypothetical protein